MTHTPNLRGTRTGRISTVSVNNNQEHLSLQRLSEGRYAIVSFSAARRCDTHLGYVVADCAAEVQNLDNKSDGYGCFGISDRVRVGDIVFGSEVIEAPSIAAIRTVSPGVHVATYDSHDI